MCYPWSSVGNSPRWVSPACSFEARLVRDRLPRNRNLGAHLCLALFTMTEPHDLSGSKMQGRRSALYRIHRAVSRT